MKKLGFLSMAFALLIMSCSKENNSADSSKNDRSAAGITSAIEGLETKAANASWALNDSIGVFAVKDGQSLSAAGIAEGADNRRFKAVASGASINFKTEAANIIYFPISGAKVNFISYYPYSANIQGYVCPVDVTSQVKQESIDLLYSNNMKGKSKNDTIVNLAFKHMMTRINFEIKPGKAITDAQLTGLKVVYKNMPAKASFNLVNGEFAGPVKADILSKTAADGKSTNAIMIPATTEAGVKVEFTLSTNEVFVWAIPAATKFEAGKDYKYKLTLTRTDATLSGTILDWVGVPVAGDVYAE